MTIHRTPSATAAPLLLLLTLGAAVSTPARAADRITYDDHIKPLFRDACLSCHNPDKKKGDLDLSTYQALMVGSSTGSVVEAGSTDNSTLYLVSAHTAEPHMPPNKPRIADDRLALIKQWIDGGLLESRGSKVAVAKPKVNLALDLASVGKPTEPIPLPTHLLLEPVIHSPRPTAVDAIAHNPWAPLLAIAGQRQIVLYQSDTMQFLGILPFPEGFAHDLKFTANGRYLLAAGGYGASLGKAVLFDFVTGSRITSVGDEPDALLAADISPSQRLIAVGGPGKIVKVFDSQTGEVLYSIRKHTDWITAIAFSPDGILLATGDRNGGMFVWEAATGEPFHDLRDHKDAITAVSFRADSNILASASEDGTIKLWNMIDGKIVKSFSAHDKGVRDVRFGLDGRLVSAGRDSRIKLWDGEGKMLREVTDLPDIATQSTFNHDGSRVIGGGWTGDLLTWNAADGKIIARPTSNPPTLAMRLERARAQLADFAAKEPQIQADLKAARLQADEAAAALTKAKDQLAAMQGSTPETAPQRDELAARLPELEKAAQEAAARVGPIEQQLAARTTLERRIASLEAAQKFTAVFHAQQELADAAAKLEQFTAAVEPTKAQIEKATTDKAAVKAAAAKGPADLTQRKAAVTEAEKSLTEAVAMVEAGRAAIGSFEQAVGSANDAVAARQAELDTRNQALEKAVAEVAVKEEAIKQAQKPSDPPVEQAEMERRINEATAQRDAAAAIVTQATAEQRAAAEALAAAKAQVESAAANLAKGRADLEAGEKVRQEREAKRTAAQQAMAEAKLFVDQSPARIAAAQKRIDEAKAAVKDLDNQLEKTRKQVDQLKARLAKLTADYDKSRTAAGLAPSDALSPLIDDQGL
jgi:hypothetical protein